MSVFDGDPNQLAWKCGRGNKTILGYHRDGEDFIKETALSGKSAPSDRELETFLSIGRDLSNETPTVSVFAIAQYSFPNKEGMTVLPFAEYRDAILVAYCRPPWRKGAGLP